MCLSAFSAPDVFRLYNTKSLKRSFYCILLRKDYLADGVCHKYLLLKKYGKFPQASQRKQFIFFRKIFS